MLTKMIIRNFKRFGEVEIDLSNPVVFIGPNNSGKTSALQALALWEEGLKRWNEKKGAKKKQWKSPGVAINRRDLVAVPVPSAKLLWRSLHVRDANKVKGKLVTQHVRIEIIVKGITGSKEWECGLEFVYANEQSFYCRPLRISKGKNPDRMPIPEEAGKINIAFLPPMSGLASNEIRLDKGAVNVKVGEGRTAEVLRNLCYKIYQEKPGEWNGLKNKIKDFFGVEIEPPEYILERGEIIMNYREEGTSLDLSSSGRGLQQTLLLLAYMYANPGSVLLLDEPDAHLEILRQQQTYNFLVEAAEKNGNQIVAASHSEVLLNEAADIHSVVAFVGSPHTISGSTSQLLKSLKIIGWKDYTLAEQTGWILYLEGSTDLAILQKFAEIMGYEDAIKILERPFTHYVLNEPQKARDHFHGLREAVPHLLGVALFDRLEKELYDDPKSPLSLIMWHKKEIENYFCFPETLEAYAKKEVVSEKEWPLFSPPPSKRLKIMQECIKKGEEALKYYKKSPWDANTKVSDEFLTPLFRDYFEKLKLPNQMLKKNFYHLARYLPKEKIDPEIKEKLERIVKVAKSAKPAGLP